MKTAQGLFLVFWDQLYLLNGAQISQLFLLLTGLPMDKLVPEGAQVGVFGTQQAHQGTIQLVKTGAFPWG